MCDMTWFGFISQWEVGSSRARVPSAPAAVLLSSVGRRATPPAPTASATPAWGATGRPHTPATTPTAPPAQVRPHSDHTYQATSDPVSHPPHPVLLHIYQMSHDRKKKRLNERVCIKLWPVSYFQTTTWTILQGLCPLMTAGLLSRSPTPQAWALCPTPPTPHLIPGKPRNQTQVTQSCAFAFFGLFPIK